MGVGSGADCKWDRTRSTQEAAAFMGGSPRAISQDRVVHIEGPSPYHTLQSFLDFTMTRR